MGEDRPKKPRGRPFEPGHRLSVGNSGGKPGRSGRKPDDLKRTIQEFREKFGPAAFEQIAALAEAESVECPQCGHVYRSVPTGERLRAAIWLAEQYAGKAPQPMDLRHSLGDEEEPDLRGLSDEELLKRLQAKAREALLS